ncbi:MAG: ATP-binding protein [Clostridia bacterium]
MLVQFKVKNCFSFKDEAILDLSAIKSYKEHEYNLIDINKDENFLKVATIYGANASGKSNLFYAMAIFQEIVVKSFNTNDSANDLIIKKNYYPFKFTQIKSPTEFEIVQIIDDIEYNYGFEYTGEEIISEWLYKKKLSTNRTTTIFERTNSKIIFGSSVKRYCEKFKKQIPAETLALTFFNKLKLKTEIFNDVFGGIVEISIMPSKFYESTFFLSKLLAPTIDQQKESLLSFLSAIDTGIKDIYYKKSEDDIDFFTSHYGEDGETYTLDLFNESEGTLKSISIYINATIAIKNGTTLFVDELNAKLHPFLLKFIVDLFHSNNNKKAQLIYTTHDTTLLDKKFFRRDQIWFVEKDKFGYSNLSALSDFKIRTDASFEKDYLSGVYGGVPIISDIQIKGAI